jgi:hypothetical protein
MMSKARNELTQVGFSIEERELRLSAARVAGNETEATLACDALAILRPRYAELMGELAQDETECRLDDAEGRP